MGCNIDCYVGVCSMKVVIAGSRTIDDKYYSKLIYAVKQAGYDITEVVSGCAYGPDRMGEKYARALNIPVTHMPADWNRYGKAAGPIRNKKMAEYADAAIVLWDGHSSGAKNMYKNMVDLDKPVYLLCVDVERNI